MPMVPPSTGAEYARRDAAGAFGEKAGLDSRPARSGLARPVRSEAEEEAHRTYRALCDQLLLHTRRLADFVDQDYVTDEGLEVVVRIEELFEEMYDCGWGSGENLKRLVVAVQSQIGNVRWNRSHVSFLNNLIPFLRQRYLIDGSVVSECQRMVKEHGLDLFRGTVHAPEVRREYSVVVRDVTRGVEDEHPECESSNRTA